MPRGYERVDSAGADHKDEHGIPLYPIRPEDGVAVTVTEPSVTVHVGGAAAATAAISGASPSGPAPLYYGESHGLYTPIAHNEVIERHDQQPGMPVPQTLQSVPPAPAAVRAPVASTNPYPAYAAQAAYPQLPASAPIVAAVPLPGAMPGMPPQMMSPVQPVMYAPQLQVPQQQLVSVVPPVPQTLVQLRAMLDSRYVAFDTGRYLREGWAFTRQNFCFFLGAILGLGLLSIAAWMALYGIFVAAHWEKPWMSHHRYEENDTSGGGSYDDDGVRGGMAYWWMVGGGFQWATLIREMLYEVLIATPVTAGTIATIFEAIRDNQYMKWRTLFSAFSCPYWVRLAGLSLLLSVLTRVLCMVFVIPGIWFAIVSMFAIPFHLQFKHIPLRAMHSIVFSVKTLHRNCCSYFGFVIACALLNLFGMLLLGVGLFVTIPITAAASAYCYHHLVGINGAAVMVPIETAVAYQQQAAAMSAAVAVPPVALPVALPVPQQHQQTQVVVVVSPQHSQAH